MEELTTLIIIGHLEDGTRLSPDSIANVRKAMDNPELVLVAVPKEVDSLVGWKDTYYGPIRFDPFTGAMEYNSEGIKSTDMVWHWVREDKK